MTSKEQPDKPKLPPRKNPLQAALDHAPWLPCDYTPGEVLSIQALAAGTATAAEQKMALAWILKLTGINDQPFFPGGEDGRRSTDFALGKADVGRQIAKLVKLNLERIRGGEHGEHG